MKVRKRNLNLPDDFNEDNLDIVGTIEYESNTGRKNRIARYRSLANVDEDFEINEDNIDEYSFNKTCNEYRCDSDRLKAELMGQRWDNYELD